MSDRRFPRSARLLRAPDFKRVFDRPVRIRDARFTVLAFRTESYSARLGLAVSKKYLKRAVDRNRVKRLIREVFRHRRNTLNGFDLVVMVGPAALRTDNRELAESLGRQFDKLAAGPVS